MISNNYEFVAAYYKTENKTAKKISSSIQLCFKMSSLQHTYRVYGTNQLRNVTFIRLRCSQATKAFFRRLFTLNDRKKIISI